MSRSSDFVAPADSGKPDYVGGFVVTAGIEEVAIAERFERANDDYNSILVKALADRFAEAFAERLHENVRKEFWGYAPDENLAPDELVGESYQGIRPAPGYPAQPDHTEKVTLFRLLDAENERRRQPDREHGHVAWLVRLRASISRILKATISVSPRSSATRSRTMPSARA